jgi:hypothetical protein
MSDRWRNLRRTVLLCLATTVVITAVPFAEDAHGREAPGFVTVLFGRTQWVSTRSDCTRLPNTVTLGRAHQDLAARGLDAVGVVILPRTPERGFRCFGGYTKHPGWERLQAWDRDGWAFVSGGTHSDVSTMTWEAQRAETCGSLRAFEAHDMHGWGMYAYANNQWSWEAQTDHVSRCFTFGRRYSPFRVNHRSSTGSPWFQWTHSVNGGKCNDSSLPCYRSAGAARSRYHSPVRLAQMVRADPNTWFSVQFYRFVEGSHHGGQRWTWDCTGTDWRRHYTSQWELYCYKDFIRVMHELRQQVASGAVVEAGPARIGKAWGRIPPTQA